MYIKWKEVYNIGHETIDHQHKKLIDLINEIHDAQQNAIALALVEDVFNRLVDYTVYHFSTEEKLFLDHNYPVADEHISEHEEFIAKIFYLKFQAKDGNLLITMKIIDYLKNWLIKHILGTDQEFGQFLKHNNDDK